MVEPMKATDEVEQFIKKSQHEAENKMKKKKRRRELGRKKEIVK